MNTATLTRSAPFASEHSVAEMFDLSKRMQAVATQLASEANLGHEVQSWHTSANADVAAFNKLHNL
jgi:hypothetical protein